MCDPPKMSQVCEKCLDFCEFAIDNVITLNEHVLVKGQQSDESNNQRDC